MVAGETPGVVPATPRVIDTDVVVMPLAQLLNGSFNVSVGEENGIGFVSRSIWVVFPWPGRLSPPPFCAGLRTAQGTLSYDQLLSK